MSGDPLQQEHEKKIVRFTVSGKDSRSVRNTRNFKNSFAAARHRDKIIRKGYTDVGMWMNTTIYKTERIS